MLRLDRLAIITDSFTLIDTHRDVPVAENESVEYFTNIFPNLCALLCLLLTFCVHSMRVCDHERVVCGIECILVCMHNKKVFWRYNVSENEPPPPSVKAGYGPETDAVTRLSRRILHMLRQTQLPRLRLHK